jgi:hypothetical protein
MPKMEFIRHLSTETEHSLMYRVLGTDIYCEIHTRRNKASRKFGKEKQYWYHRDDPKNHNTYEEAVRFKC